MTMTDVPPGWVLTIEGVEYVAYRPIGWEGPDPHVRVSAPTRDALIHKLTAEETPVLDPTTDPDAPLTPAEEEAHRRQGERLERETRMEAPQ